MRKWSDLAIGVKTSQHGLLTHNAAYALEFFLDALLENELAADAADENRQFRGDAARLETRSRRADSARRAATRPRGGSSRWHCDRSNRRRAAGR